MTARRWGTKLSSLRKHTNPSCSHQTHSIAIRTNSSTTNDSKRLADPFRSHNNIIRLCHSCVLTESVLCYHPAATFFCLTKTNTFPGRLFHFQSYTVSRVTYSPQDAAKSVFHFHVSQCSIPNQIFSSVSTHTHTITHMQ